MTDAGLEHLKGLTQTPIGWTCWDTQVTDAGLVHLKGLSQLQWLNLTSTRVTRHGVEKLQKALPNCEIHFH